MYGAAVLLKFGWGFLQDIICPSCEALMLYKTMFCSFMPGDILLKLGLGIV